MPAGIAMRRPRAVRANCRVKDWVGAGVPGATAMGRVRQGEAAVQGRTFSAATAG
jgi:hypothetical protein